MGHWPLDVKKIGLFTQDLAVAGGLIESLIAAGLGYVSYLGLSGLSVNPAAAHIEAFGGINDQYDKHTQFKEAYHETIPHPITLVLMLSLACSLGGLGSCSGNPTEQEELPQQSEKRCGDDVCDGPENPQNCPEDCSAVVLAEDQKETQKPTSQNIGGDTKAFRISMNINAESNMQGVAGSDTQFYYEPVIIGFVEIVATFPAGGGSAISQAGTVTLYDYHGKGPYCSVEVEDGMIGSTSAISFDDIYWEPAGRMNFSAEVSYENLAFDTHWSCPPKPAYTAEEYPMYKLVGIFNEEMRTLSIMLDQSFSTQDLIWGPNGVFQTDLDIVVEEIE